MGHVFIISTPRRDIHGTCVNINGWQLDNYRTNPIVEWSVESRFVPHNPDQVIGTSRVWIEDDKLYGEWFPEPYNELATKLEKKFKNGTSLGASVNFLQIDGRYGIGDERKGGEKETYYYMRQELLSWKICFLPSNQDCVYQRHLSNDKRTYSALDKARDEQRILKAKMDSFLKNSMPNFK